MPVEEWCHSNSLTVFCNRKSEPLRYHSFSMPLGLDWYSRFLVHRTMRKTHSLSELMDTYALVVTHLLGEEFVRVNQKHRYRCTPQQRCFPADPNTSRMELGASWWEKVSLSLTFQTVNRKSLFKGRHLPMLRMEPRSQPRSSAKRNSSIHWVSSIFTWLVGWSSSSSSSPSANSKTSLSLATNSESSSSRANACLRSSDMIWKRNNSMPHGRACLLE